MGKVPDRRVEERLLAPLSRAGVLEPKLHVGPKLPTPTFWREGTRYWYLAPPEQDPLIRVNGTLPVPEEVGDLLRRLADDPAWAPDEILIGHEFPDGVDPRDLIVPRADDRGQVGRDFISGTKRTGETLTALLKGAAVVSGGLLAVTGALLAAFATVDPVVIVGCQVDPERYAYVEVARWTA